MLSEPVLLPFLSALYAIVLYPKENLIIVFRDQIAGIANAPDITQSLTSASVFWTSYEACSQYTYKYIYFRLRTENNNIAVGAISAGVSHGDQE